MPNIDGKAKNLSFKTSNVSEWKETFLEHFGPSLATSLKDGKVVKVLFETNKTMNALKINFYDKVLLLYKVQNTYFQILKNKVNQTDKTSYDWGWHIDSTPKKLSPKEKSKKLSKTVEHKFNEIHNILSIIDKYIETVPPPPTQPPKMYR